MFSDVRASTPRRFVTRTLLATLSMVAFVLSAVLVLVTLSVRDHVRQSVVEKLTTGQRLLATMEERRIDVLRSQAATLAESPTLKAALDTYHAERRTAPPAVRSQLLETVRQGARQARHAPLGGRGGGTRRQRRRALGLRHATPRSGPPSIAHAEHELHRRDDPDAPVRRVSRRDGPVRPCSDEELGSVLLAQALDDRYVAELSALSGAQRCRGFERPHPRDHPVRRDRRGAHPRTGANLRRRRADHAER